MHAPALLVQSLPTLFMQDDEAELLKELNRIKAERAAEQAKQAAATAAESQTALQEELIRGNPLIHQANFQVGGMGFLICFFQLPKVMHPQLVLFAGQATLG